MIALLVGAVVLGAVVAIVVARVVFIVAARAVDTLLAAIGWGRPNRD